TFSGKWIALGQNGCYYLNNLSSSETDCSRTKPHVFPGVGLFAGALSCIRSGRPVVVAHALRRAVSSRLFSPGGATHASATGEGAQYHALGAPVREKCGSDSDFWPPPC